MSCTCKQNPVGQLSCGMFANKNLRRPDEYLKRAGDIQDLRARSSDENDRSYIWARAIRLLRSPHAQIVAPARDGSNDKDRSFSANLAGKIQMLTILSPCFFVGTLRGRDHDYILFFYCAITGLHVSHPRREDCLCARSSPSVVRSSCVLVQGRELRKRTDHGNKTSALCSND